MISRASLSWEMVLTTDTVSSKFIVSIYIRLRTFWMPLVHRIKCIFAWQVMVADCSIGLLIVCSCYKSAWCIAVGQQIIEALENGVSKYPTLEGRFPQVSGISFGFDPTKPPGQRIDPSHVKVQGSYIELDKVTSFCFSFGASLTVSCMLFSDICHKFCLAKR